MYEAPPPPGASAACVATRLGVAAVDVAAGHVLVGEFEDDEVRVWGGGEGRLGGTRRVL